jgi:hypothetical protein
MIMKRFRRMTSGAAAAHIGRATDTLIAWRSRHRISASVSS